MQKEDECFMYVCHDVCDVAYYEDHQNFFFVGYFHGVVASVSPCNSRPYGFSCFSIV